MSMSNFMGQAVLALPVMATKNHLVRDSTPPTDASDSGVGMAHPTVVPANFDPDAPGNRRD